MHTVVCRQHGDENAVYYATYAISSYNLCITNIVIKMATVIFTSKINYTGLNNNNNNNNNNNSIHVYLHEKLNSTEANYKIKVSINRRENIVST
jgi:hypothetical protein